MNNLKEYTNKTTNNITSNFSQTINTHNLSIKLPLEESMKNEILDILNLNNFKNKKCWWHRYLLSISRRIIQRIEKLLCRNPRNGHRSFSCGYKVSCFQRFS